MPATTSSENTTSGRTGSSGGESARSNLFQTISAKFLTPINFITFLVSLWLVDCGYDDERLRRHAAGRRATTEQQHGQDGHFFFLFPAWLHRLLFTTTKPYAWVDQNQGSRAAAAAAPEPPNRTDERYYYHTKQRKLMKMEAADAFGLRVPVLFALSALVAVAAWAAWRLGWGLVSSVSAAAAAGW